MDLIDQVEAWMREVSPGLSIVINAILEIDLVNIQYFYGDSNRYRATNVGFGITYTLPIIISVLSCRPSSLILVENPEAYLYPRGKAKMGELLALAASCGIQVVIETHSAHILYGIRLAVHRRKINYEDVQLHYFQRQEIGTNKVLTEVGSPHNIDKYRRIDRWTDGFFDKMGKDIMELMYMQLLINENQFIGQAKDSYDADALMEVLLAKNQELEPIQGEKQILDYS
ncbi:AAA family ATPase [Trichormus azollae]|jgi:predicted ATPase|uniref:ATPase AAA-type core domain-containing protein n=1 Tax=Nostoc azollae (strain 0708) TaxID=551115 RepID=D7DXQ6_NOSA0|nr:DUF3696 domain-containing protein [Trichormus azollae]ADI65882.1 conserved hypothetical protein ['Nostoc azollae' 0708]